MIQQFLRTASDGWDLALASVRNLFAEADLHADEVGGDFAGEAERLGAAVADVHAVLREHFPTSTVDTASVAARMREQFDDWRVQVPALELARRRSVNATFDRLDGLGTEAVQRVHGDLHLGQTLRTSVGWKLVDFEGEPAKPLAERVLPDSPWRDVAGHAALVRLRGALGGAGTSPRSPTTQSDQLAFRSTEWAERNREAFLSGYLGVARSAAEESAHGGGVRSGQGHLRSRLRGPQPTGVDRDPPWCVGESRRATRQRRRRERHPSARAAGQR